MNLLKICDEVASAAAKAAKPLFGTPAAAKKIGLGAGGDVTVRIDKAAEDAAITVLKKYGINLITEEAGRVGLGGSKYIAVLDPIDGSMNAKRGIPIFAVSIALADGKDIGSIKAGMIKEVMSGETYYAERGHGALKNGAKIKCSRITGLEEATAIMEIDHRTRESYDRMEKIIRKIRYVRGFGSAAFDLCMVAQGSAELYVDFEWDRVTDVAAGYLIVKEAGGIVSDMHGNSAELRPLDLKHKSALIASANREIHEKILNLLGGRK